MTRKSCTTLLMVIMIAGRLCSHDTNNVTSPHQTHSSNLQISDAKFTLLNNPFSYGNYYSDAESGMYYCMSRYYCPESMSFISRDTFSVQNRYSYCSCNPIGFSDPSGHMKRDLTRKQFETGIVRIPQKPELQEPVPMLSLRQQLQSDITASETLHLFDIDGSLITRTVATFINPTDVLYNRSKVSRLIPRQAIDSQNAILYTAGDSVTEDPIDDLSRKRKEAVETFFPKLYERGCLSIRDANNLDSVQFVPINGIRFYSKFAFFNDETFANFDSVILWDNDIEHIKRYLCPQTIKQLKTINARLYFAHLQDAPRIEGCKINFYRFIGEQFTLIGKIQYHPGNS